MSSDLQFVIESAGLVGVFLLVVFTIWVVGSRPPTRVAWLRLGGFLTVGFVWLYVAGGGSAMFRIVVGVLAFMVAMVIVTLGLVLGWRRLRRREWNSLERQAATNFAGAGLFALMAVAFLAFGLLCLGGWADNSANDRQYKAAPVCSAAESISCLARAQGTVVQKWAERPKGPHWVDVRVADRTQSIQVETGVDVWNTLVDRQTVEITSWKGKVTAITVPGVGTMQTPDSPQFLGFMYPLLAGGSAFGFLLFLVGAVTYTLKAKLATMGIDPEKLVA